MSADEKVVGTPWSASRCAATHTEREMDLWVKAFMGDQAITHTVFSWGFLIGGLRASRQGSHAFIL